MSPSASPAAAPRRLSFAQKLALAGGAGAAITGIAPQSVDAAVIQSTTLPLSPPATAGFNSWDIDSDGTEDFRLRNLVAGSAGNQASFGNVGAAPSLARFVGPTTLTESLFAKLSRGFNVGSAMTGFFFPTSNEFNSMTRYGAIGFAAAENGWALGDIGFFGFKFTNGSGVHYGWGTIDIHGVTGTFVQGQGFTVTEAYYNDVAGAPITVGDRGGTAVPEIDPASAGSVLALVMGSLAMLERRRLRRAADDSVTTVSA